MRETVNKATFAQDFLNNYVPSVSIKKLKKLNCYAPDFGYLWMVCEHNLVNNLKGDAAMIAYDAVGKDEAIEFQYDNGFLGDNVSVPLSAENDTSEKIKKSGLYEFYVIGKDFAWCYIVTHESNGCGPYFITK